VTNLDKLELLETALLKAEYNRNGGLLVKELEWATDELVTLWLFIEVAHSCPVCKNANRI
jgi:hypothetical protein